MRRMLEPKRDEESSQRVEGKHREPDLGEERTYMEG